MAKVKGSEHSSFLPPHSIISFSLSTLPMWPLSGYSLPFCTVFADQ